MKIQVNTDTHIDGHERLAAHVSATIEHALRRFTDHITRVEVHLSDGNGDNTGPQDQRCMLEVRLEHRQPVAVAEHAKTQDQAINGATHKMLRLLDSTLGRLSDHRDRATVAPVSDTDIDQPG